MWAGRGYQNWGIRSKSHVPGGNQLRLLGWLLSIPSLVSFGGVPSELEAKSSFSANWVLNHFWSLCKALKNDCQILSVDLRLLENQEKVFTCQVSGGNPIPTKVSWYLEDLLLQEEWISNNGQSLVTQITSNWQGKTLKCSVSQTDTFGHEIG